MTARNQYMPGVQERILDRDGGAGAGAGASAAGRGFRPRRHQNGNGSVAGGQGRCTPAEYLPSTIQPLPLASRYGGSGKHDSLRSSPSALESSWIRRLLSSSDDGVGCGELGSGPSFAWKNLPGSVLGGAQGSNHSPLLLAGSTRDQEDREDAWIGDMSLKDDDDDTDANGSGTARYLLKGKVVVQDLGHGYDSTTSRLPDVRKNEGSTSLPNHPRIASGEGRQQLPQDENPKGAPYVCGDPRVNGVSGGKVTGFGPLRVLLKPSSNDFKKPVSVAPKPKASSMEGGSRTEGTAVPAGLSDFRRPAVVPTTDRRQNDVPVMASNTGTKFTALPESATQSKISGIRPSRHVEFAGRVGSFNSQSMPDSRNPCTDGAARETALPVGASKEVPRFRPFGEYHLSHTIFGDELLSRTPFGEDRPSQGHFGEDHLSRRPFGEEHVPHRRFGEDHQSRRPFGENHQSHRPSGEDHLPHRPSGENHMAHRPSGEDVVSRWPCNEDQASHWRLGEDHQSRRPFGEDHHQSPRPFGEAPKSFRPLGEDHSSYRHTSRYPDFPDNRGIAERNKSSSKTMGGERFVPTHNASKFARNEDGGRMNGGQEMKLWQCSADANTHSEAAVGFSKGFESRKMKVFGSGHESRRPPDVGPSHQHQQRSQDLAPHQFQGDTSIGKVGFRLPFSPLASFPDEETPAQLGEDDADAGNCGGRAVPTTCLLTPLVDPVKPQDGLDGGLGQADRHTAWKSLYSPYALTHPETPNSLSTPTLPPDENSRLNDTPPHHNGLSDGPKASGSMEERSRGGGRNADQQPSFSGCHGPQFDNQSSHFSSSPWPDNESHNPKDDAGSGPYNSKATGSTYHSQVSQSQYFQMPFANHTTSGLKGQQVSTDKYDTASARDLLDKPPRIRDLSVSDNLQDRKKSTDSPGDGVAVPQISSQQNQDQLPGRFLRPLALPTMSGGLKENSSNSSPPSRPMGYYYNPDLCSLVLPRAIVDEQLFNRAVESRVVEDDCEGEGAQYERRQQGYPNSSMEFMLRRRRGLQGHDDGVHREHRDSVAARDRVQDVHKMANDTQREVNDKSGRQNEMAESGLKHGKLRTSAEAMGDAGIAGPSKRSRHYPNQNSHELATQTENSGLPPRQQGNADSTGITSSWLQRWLPSSNVKGTLPAKLKDHLTGLTPKSPRCGGSNNFMGFSRDRNAQVNTAQAVRGRRIEVDRSAQVNTADAMRGRSIKVDNGFRARKGLKQLSQENECALSPFPVPSAAAIALVSTAANKSGPVPQHRKGSFSTWEPVHLNSAGSSGDQRPVCSSELPVSI